LAQWFPVPNRTYIIRWGFRLLIMHPFHEVSCLFVTWERQWLTPKAQGQRLGLEHQNVPQLKPWRFPSTVWHVTHKSLQEIDFHDFQLVGTLFSLSKARGANPNGSLVEDLEGQPYRPILIYVFFPNSSTWIIQHIFVCNSRWTFALINIHELPMKQNQFEYIHKFSM
jgi:hypothetical protein